MGSVIRAYTLRPSREKSDSRKLDVLYCSDSVAYQLAYPAAYIISSANDSCNDFTSSR